MSNRFHNKFHRHNHHTRPTDRDGKYPDSAYDPIASPDSPFRGEFYVDGNVTTLSSISARGDSFATNATVHQSLLVKGNLTVLGDVTTLDTVVSVTSSLSVVNLGTGPALKIEQYGSQPIAHFVDANGDDIVFADDGKVGINLSNPAVKLHVGHDSNETFGCSTLLSEIQAGSSEGPKIGFAKHTPNVKWSAGIQNGVSQSGFGINENGSETSYGTTRFYVATGGKVGIGTSVPNELLTVSGNISAKNVIYDSSGNSANWNSVYSTVRTASANYILDGGNTKGSNILIGTNDNFNLALETNGLQRLTVFNNGNVGINETSPEGKLHVTAGSAGTVVAQTSSVGVFESSGNAYLSLLSPTSHYAGVVMGGPTNPYGSYVSWNHDNLALKVATNHAGGSIQMLVGTEDEALRIASSGNVGIGTTVPNEKLTVSGNVSASGTVTIGGELRVQTLSCSYLKGDASRIVMRNSSTPAVDSPFYSLSSYYGPILQTDSSLDIILHNPSVNTLRLATFANDCITKHFLAHGTEDAPVACVDQARVASMRGFAYSGNGKFLTYGVGGNASVDIRTAGAQTSANCGGEISFYTHPSNVGPSGTQERMVIKSDGDVTIGGIGTPNPNKKLTVIGDISASGNISTDSQFLSAGVDLFDIFSSISTGGLASGAYLPLSGGTVTGSVTVTGTVFAESFVLTTPGLIAFDTVSAAAIPVTTLPVLGNDVELYSTTAVTITAFQNGIKGTLYTLTNKGTGTVTITASPTNFVRNGQSWSNQYIELSTNYACSLRADINNVVSIW